MNPGWSGLKSGRWDAKPDAGESTPEARGDDWEVEVPLLWVESRRFHC